MSRKNQYLIKFAGLKDAIHTFDYEVGNAFFEELEYSEVSQGELKVKAILDKRETMMVLELFIEGALTVMCDRCTDDFALPIKGSFELIYKFAEGISEDENVVYVNENEIEIDLSQPIYEFAMVLLPAKRLHQEGMCNPEMLQAMDEYLMIEEEPTQEESPENDSDPRWDALKNLKNKN